MTPKTVGIVVECRNQGRSLLRALLSLDGQATRTAETVIVDAGSTDPFTRQQLAALERQGHVVMRVPDSMRTTALNTVVRSMTHRYIGVLGADEWVDSHYLEACIGAFDVDSTRAFVLPADNEGGLSTPAVNDVVSIATELFVPPALMFRRDAWEAVGGFDEEIAEYALLDLWLTLVAHGHRGVVLPNTLAYRGGEERLVPLPPVSSDLHATLMDRIYRKHLELLGGRPEDLLLAIERRVIAERARREELLRRRHETESRAQELERAVKDAARDLTSLGREPLDWGDFRRTTPLSPIWGLDRGRPLDRHYIHRFLESHRDDIHGCVLEVKDSGYTRVFGGDRVARVDVLDIDPTNNNATVIADLAEATLLPENTYDCFILTQTLGVIFEPARALSHAYRVLKPGGVLLCTVPAAGRISHEEGLDGDFWRFTEASVRRLFSQVFPEETFDVTGFGNVLAVAAFLFGLGPHELKPQELDARDPYVPLVYGIRAVKPCETARRTKPASETRHSTADGNRAVILMYHRIASHLPDPHQLCVAPEVFRAHLEHLWDAKYSVVSLGTLASQIRSAHLPDRTVALTFDDGYADALSSAAPSLAEFLYPATFFIVGEAVGGSHEFWWDLVQDVLLSDRPLPSQLRIETTAGSITCRTRTGAERQHAHDLLTDLLYRSSPGVRDEAIRCIRMWSDQQERSFPRRMSSVEVAALAAQPGIEIGAHTETHLLLPAQTLDIKQREVVENKRRLEHIVGHPIKSFSYPYGGNDAETARIVADAGFEIAVTTEPRLVGLDTDLLRLPRVDVFGWTKDDFSLRLAGAFAGRSQ